MTTSHDDEAQYAIKSDAERYAWAGYLLFVLASSLIGDSIILIASIKYRAFNLHKVMVVIIQHIAVCDMLMSVTYAFPMFISVVNGEWVLGNFLCSVTAYPKYYFYSTSVLLICSMTCQKALLLRYPLRFGTISGRKAHLLCVACWAAALTFPVSLLLVEGLEGQDINFSYRAYYCDHIFTASIWKWLQPLLAVLFLFIPTCLVVATTILLLVIAKQVARRGRESLKWQGIMTTILIATVHCISSLPIVLYIIASVIVTEEDYESKFFHIAFFRIVGSVLYLNTISNFYVYSLSVHSFRDFILLRMQFAYRVFNSIGASATNGKETLFQSIPHKVAVK